MKKHLSLIKASMSEDMNIFKISTKNKNKYTKIFLPILLILCIAMSIYGYSTSLILQLHTVNLEFVLLTLFIIITSFLTLIEGIYKSSNLLFNCKDDNLLLSLPIKKSSVLFVRVLKFYLFELIYNSIFIIPAMIAFVQYVKPDITFYIVSLIGLLLFPIIPILISCIIGAFITFLASKFKWRNIIQTILTIILFLGIMYLSYNSDKLITNIASYAKNINDFITKIYYPAGSYIELITNFNILKLFEFIAINLSLFIITILLIGKFYFSINSSMKSIKIGKFNKNYVIKTRRPIRALIKKEFSKFINSTVFVTNAGMGLVLFILSCILLVVKFDSFADMFSEIYPTITIEQIRNYISIILFALICFASFMTSITSSMISLEGRSFNILKSLPIKPYTIVKAKVLTSVLVMIPCILIGDIIVFLNFKFDIISVFLILIASVLLPLLNQTIGIIINLKYPRMDAKNDTEVVKQSMSSTISVFIGMGLFILTVFLLYQSIFLYNALISISNNIIILMFLCGYAVFYSILLIILHKTCDKNFNNISV